jgi:photosystem II stability/assembly factor-like uncharacterized protein
MRKGAMTVVVGVLLAGGLAAACTSSDSGPVPATSTPAAASPSPFGSGAAPGTASTASRTTAASSSAPSRASSTPAPAAGPAGGPVPSGFTPTSTTFVSADTGWVLGTAPCSTKPCTSILRTRNAGRSWQGIPAPKASLGQPDSARSGDVTVLRFADQLDGWAGVNQLYSTHDGGATWHRQQIGQNASVVTAIETSGGYVYVLTTDCASQSGTPCTGSSNLYASPVGKNNWQKLSSLAPVTTTSSLVVTGNTWFVSTQNSVYRGTNSRGAKLLSDPCPTDEGERAAPYLAAADSSHLDALCLGEGGAGSAQYQLYGTSNGGHSWQKDGGKHLEASGLFGIADNGRGVLLAATASGGSYILRTTDDGQSFPKASVDAPTGGYSWADLGFTTTTQALAVLPGHGLYLSHDTGRTFAKVNF